MMYNRYTIVVSLLSSQNITPLCLFFIVEMVGIKVYSFCSFGLYVRSDLQLIVSRGGGGAGSTVFFIAGLRSHLLLTELDIKGVG